MEFIHPFTDGNGRIGRLWQTRILQEWNPRFACLPIETVVRDRQEAYYRTLTKSDNRNALTSNSLLSTLLKLKDGIQREQAAHEKFAQKLARGQ